MNSHPVNHKLISPTSEQFYQYALEAALETGLPLLLGGAAAFGRYTGIARDTKDVDLFIYPRHCRDFLEAFARLGHRAELTFPHWLGKVLCNGHCVDLIFSSGNGIVRVDEEWFEHAVPGKAWGLSVPMVPVEEMIWSKSYVQERERYDGADIAHLLLACGDRLDWERLLRRFGDHWRVLFAHLVLFGFVYPTARDRIPADVLRDLTDRFIAEVNSEPPHSSPPICQGTLLSREQYLDDIAGRGFQDARLRACGGAMSSDEIAHWTKAITDKE